MPSAPEVALALGALLTLRDADDRAASTWMAGHAIADGADLMATLAARRHLPTSGVVFAVAMAGASTAVAAWSVYRLASGVNP